MSSLCTNENSFVRCMKRVLKSGLTSNSFTIKFYKIEQSFNAERIVN